MINSENPDQQGTRARYSLVVSKSAISARLWQFSLVCFVTYGIWQLVALFYGWMPFAWSKAILAIGAASALPQALLVRKGARVSPRELALAVLVLAIIFSVILQISFFRNMTDIHGRDSHAYLFGVAASSLAWLMVGYALQIRGVARQSNFVAMALLCGVSIPVVGALDGGLVVKYWLFRDDVEEASHLTVAAAAYFLLVMSYAFARGWFRVGVFLVALFVLFALGGRSELALMIVSVVAYEWMRGMRRSMFIPITMILIGIAATVFSLLGPVLDQPGVSKMVFLGGLSEDSSYVARRELLATNLRILPDQAFVGDVSALVRLHGGLGSYIHNLLSAWQFYGAFVFGLIAVMLATNVRRVRRLIRRSPDAMTAFGAICFISAFVGVLISKAVTYQGLWFVLGFYAGKVSLDTQLKRHRKALRRPSQQQMRDECVDL